MKVLFTELAAKEFRESQSFYEIEVQGLGNEFKKEIITSIKRILKYPEAYPVLRSDVRKFPFNVFYSIENDFILILSIAHQHRKPSL